MRYFFVLILLVAGCASIPQHYYDGVNVKRSDGLYGDWKTSNHSNEFSSWTSSRVYGEKAGWLSKQPFIEVQGKSYLGIDTGDSYICGKALRVNLAWQKNDGQKLIEEISMQTSKNNETLILYGHANSQWKRIRFLHQLNYWDKLTVQTNDSCGEYTIVRFNISGTHHVATTETNAEGFKNTIDVVQAIN
jgi:hypothetical protein